MRQIKFRAWQKETLKMFIVKKLAMFKFWKGNKTKQKYSVTEKYTTCKSPVEIMQFTGLKDKNGKEIYEGDIVEQTFYGDDISKMIIIVKDIRIDYSELHPGSSKENEVIGNIYENPKLMEETKPCAA